MGMLDKYVMHFRVRNLFQGDKKNRCKLKFHTLLEKKHMQVGNGYSYVANLELFQITHFNIEEDLITFQYVAIVEFIAENVIF